MYIFKQLQPSFCCFISLLHKKPPQIQWLKTATFIIIVPRRLFLSGPAGPGLSSPRCPHPYVWALRVGSWDGWTGPFFTWPVIPGGQLRLVPVGSQGLSSKRGSPSAQVPLPKTRHMASSDSRAREMQSSSCWKELPVTLQRDEQTGENCDHFCRGLLQL